MLPISTRRFVGCAIAFVLAVVLAGCGRESGPSAAPAAPSASTAPRPPDITIKAGDDMKFSVTRIEAAPGERINLTLVITGRMPKSAMGHNLVLLAAGTDARAYSMAAMTAAATDYLPPAESAKVLAHTRMMGPGESQTISFDAPSEPGSYPYVCTFPGHYLNGMAGVLVVK